MFRIGLIVILGMFISVATGCSTVSVTSDPSGAKAYVRNGIGSWRMIGRTPAEAGGGDWTWAYVVWDTDTVTVSDTQFSFNFPLDLLPYNNNFHFVRPGGVAAKSKDIVQTNVEERLRRL